MADNRIAGLNAITEINTALDFLPIVDVSDNQMAGSGTTKKITINQILGAGGSVVVPLGTAAAPAISFSGDPNTGIFSTQADQLAITVGGTTRGIFSSTGLSITGSLSVTSSTLVSNLNSDLLDGQHGSYYQDAGNITAGTLSVARGGTGATTFTAGQVLYGNGTSALSSSANLFWDSSNNRLGIGTATPATNFHVSGGPSYFTNGSGSAADIEIAGNNNTAGTGSLLIRQSASNEAMVWNRASAALTLGTASVEKFRIASDGVCTWSNVGGVAVTAMTLNGTGLGVGVSPNISASGKALTVSGAFTRSRLELQNTDGGTSGVTCGTISWFNGSNLIADITGAANSGSATLGSLAFSTGGSTRLTIDSSGNLGIGTATPSQKLDVSGAVNSVQARFGNVAGRGLEIGTSLVAGTNDAGSVLNAKGATSGTLIFQTDSTERLRITSTGVSEFSGNISMGSGYQVLLTDGTTSAPGAAFTADTNTGIYRPAADTVAVVTGGVERAKVDSSGNVILTAPLRAANGNAAAPSISFDSDTDTGVYRIAANTIGITTGGITAVRINPTGSFGYSTDIGGAVTQATSRTTGVTLSKPCGSITLFSAAGSTAWQTFTVTNSVVEATDVIKVCQQSGTDLYQIHVTNVASGSFKITFATTGGTTTEQPVFNFAVIKASAGAV